jgi:hypothetical protein
MRWQAHKLGPVLAPDTIVSDVGYAVLRCTANDIPTGRFIAFRVLVDKRIVLGGYDSADEARQACETHYARLAEVA